MSVEKQSQNLTEKGSFEPEDIQLGTIVSTSGEMVNVHGDMKHMDQALRLALQTKDMSFTEEEDKKLLRKIDFALIPFVSFLYSLFYVDKASNGWAAVMGIRKDMHMVNIQIPN